MRAGKLWLQVTRLGIGLNRCFFVVQLLQHCPKVVPGHRILGFDLHRSVVVLRGTFVVLLRLQSNRKVVVHFGTRLNRNGATDQFNGCGGVAFLLRHQADQMQSLGMVWLQLQNTLVGGDGFGIAFIPMQGHGGAHQRINVGGQVF